jgi:hypothetical protein
MEAPDADSTENQVDRRQMEKMVPELLEDGIMTTTVGHVDLI